MSQLSDPTLPGVWKENPQSEIHPAPSDLTYLDLRFPLCKMGTVRVTES